MPVMKARCATCPFLVDPKLAAQVQQRMLSGSQLCHSTGWPQSTHLCRGARDFQLVIFHRLGYLEAPTDDAWEQKCQEVFA